MSKLLALSLSITATSANYSSLSSFFLWKTKMGERLREANKKQADGRLKVRAFLVTDAKSTKQIGLDEAHYRGFGSSKIVHYYCLVGRACAMP